MKIGCPKCGTVVATMGPARRYSRFVARRLHSPRLFLGLWPVGVCVWRDWAITLAWHGWGHKYRR